MAELCEFIEYDGHVGSPIVLQNGHKRPKNICIGEKWFVVPRVLGSRLKMK